MKQEKIEFRLKWGRLIIVNIVYVIGMCFILWYSMQKINTTYAAIMTEKMVIQSKETYDRCMKILAVLTVILNGLWLCAVCGRSEIRRTCEENTLFCSVGLSVAVFLVLIAAGLKCPGITDDLGNPYPLYYFYSVGFWFLVNLFGFPPENVEKVMFFGGSVGRWCVAIAALIFTGVCLSI